MQHAIFVTFGPNDHDVEVYVERAGGRLGPVATGSGHRSGHTHLDEADEEIQRETAKIVA
jgi:hypothetical protein